jgi:hypothetical protein
MVWSAAYLAWPWIGLVGAVFSLSVLFGTNKLRSDLKVSRWYDPQWLSWLTIPVYLVHQFEEYIFDPLGNTYVIPDSVCLNLGFQTYPNCPIPILHYPVVNITLVWFAAPLAALLFRRNRIVGMSLYGFIFLNGCGHLFSVLANGLTMYTAPGAATGSLIFLPLCCWLIYAWKKNKFMSGKALCLYFLSGIIGHLVLGLSYGLFVKGLVGASGMVLFDVFAGFSSLLAAAVLSKIFVGLFKPLVNLPK